MINQLDIQLLSCIICGIIFFALDLYYIDKIRKIIEERKTKRVWFFIESLILLFIGGYTILLFFSIDVIKIEVPVMVGFVFSFGALFTFVVITQSYKTYLQLLDVNNKQKKLLDTLIKNVQFKTDFMATMSHELRTPLNAIIGFTELFLEGIYGELDKEQKESLHNVHTSAEYLLDMVNRILDISKIESDRVKIYVQPVILRDLVEEIIHEYKNEIDAKKIKINYTNINSDTIVHADRFKLKIILSELIDNALKFTNKGTITIRFLEREDDFEIVVSDTGVGIPENSKNRVFREFERVSVPEAQKFEGAGLGLPLVKRLIKLHGGHINFTSEYGKGTSFVLTLPKVKNVEILEDECINIQKYMAKFSKEKKKIKILIVEDIKKDLIIIKTLLNKITAVELSIKEADRLFIAIEYLKEDKFDIVLLDLNLPDSKGLATLDAIIKFDDKIPVVVITAVGDNSFGELLVKRGAEDFILKSEITSASLAKTIIYAIQRHKQKTGFDDTRNEQEEEIKHQ
ncbi:MAG: ATP-binding response regulator [Promethearchaeota archaeon]